MYFETLPVELGSASAATAAGWLDGGPLAVAFVSWCVCLSCIDLMSRRLPNSLTGAGAAAIVVYSGVVGAVPAMLAGAVALFGCYLAVHLAAPRALGAGDVKLAWSLGGVTGMTGVDAWAVAAVAAPLLTGLCGLALSAAGRSRTPVPHGPAMCAATLLALAA